MFTEKQVNIISRPGYFGKKRREIEQELDTKHPGWMECWQVADRIFTFDEAVMLYDDSYFQFFLTNSNILEFARRFGECYDSDRSNIACGITHDPKASPRHIQDVSVRRALIRLGTYFQHYRGPDEKLYPEEELLHIRGENTNGYVLMPGNIPFHLKNVICGLVVPEKWVKHGSVEHFWQSNKVIVVPGV